MIESYEPENYIKIENKSTILYDLIYLDSKNVILFYFYFSGQHFGQHRIYFARTVKINTTIVFSDIL